SADLSLDSMQRCTSAECSQRLTRYFPEPAFDSADILRAGGCRCCMGWPGSSDQADSSLRILRHGSRASCDSDVVFRDEVAGRCTGHVFVATTGTCQR